MRTLVVVALLAGVVFAGCVTSDEIPDDPTPAVASDGVAVGTMRELPFESFEPTLGVDATGTLFMSIFGGGLTDIEHVARSRDQGATWDDVTARVAGVSIAPNSNDPYVHVDQDTDRVFNFDMHALTCMTLSWSDDQGDTWSHNPIGCGQPAGGQDHQTFWTSRPRTVETVGYDNVLHYCVNRVADVACSLSVDGGLSWSPLRPVVFLPCVGVGSLTGHGVGGPEGRIYLGKNHCNVPTVAVSEDDGLTWSTVAVSDTPIDGHDVNLGTDEVGNVYATWRSEGRILLAVSTDHGQSWGDPIDVMPADVLMGEFPVVEGAGAGQAALAYYGSTVRSSRSDLESEDPWNAYMTVVRNATDAPVVETVRLNVESDPIARGPCDDDNRCRGVGDFIDIVIDGEGRPWVALVDTCREDCIDDPSAGTGGVRGAVGTLAAGLSLVDGATPLALLAEAPDDDAEPTPSATQTAPPSAR